MTISGLPGRLIGSGRAADVYELDGGRVLRRYRIPIDAGPPGADVAIASLIMRVSEVDSLPLAVRLIAGIVRESVVQEFEAHVNCDFRPHLAEAAELRIRDPNVRPTEIDQLRRIITSARLPSAPSRRSKGREGALGRPIRSSLAGTWRSRRYYR